MKEFIFTWSIENVSFSWNLTENGIISPSFIASPMQNTVWYLQLLPKVNSTEDYLALFLYKKSGSSENISVNFELSCITTDKSLLHSHTFKWSHKVLGHPRFMKRHEVFVQKKDLYLPGDVLTLRCRMWYNENNFDEFGESFGFTRLEIERISTIENIGPRIIKENTINIHSKIRNKVLISISILQNKDSIDMKITPGDIQNIYSSVLKLSFLDKSNGKILYEHLCCWLSAPASETWRLPIQFQLPNTGNKDTAWIDVELSTEFAYATGQQIERLEKNCPSSSRLSELVSKYINACNSGKNVSNYPAISQDLWNLYVEQDLCDLELKTQTTSLYVHKFVLCARSSVFLAMLTVDMKEKIKKYIEIEDIRHDILTKFVRFLYTDSFEDLEWETVVGLYYAADKYQVIQLKNLCCSYMLKNINFDNVCEILMLADRHHDSDFKRRIEDFILQNDEKIFSSSMWKKFIDEQPFLPAKIMSLKYDKDRGNENTPETYEKKLSKHPNVQDDFTAAYKSKIINDIIIKTSSATFPANKFVLCAKSVTMRERITRNLTVKATDIIEVHDLEDDTVSRMLNFLYTDSLEDVQWDIALKLYQAADVYQIQSLKFRCSCFLLENLETSNASNLLLLAHQHRDDRLKSAVVDYIFMYEEKIFGSLDWANFSESNFRLANETMRSKYKKK